MVLTLSTSKETQAILFSFRHFLFMKHLVKQLYAGLPPSMAGQWSILNRCWSSISISMRHCLETPLLVQREKHAHQRPSILNQCNEDNFFKQLLMYFPWPFSKPSHVIKRYQAQVLVRNMNFLINCCHGVVLQGNPANWFPLASFHMMSVKGEISRHLSCILQKKILLFLVNSRLPGEIQMKAYYNSI